MMDVGGGILLVAVLSILSQLAPSTGTIAIDPERHQLLKDALGWMSFKKNGELLKDSELAPLFLDALRNKYSTSKLYRTFVIAFQHGVLPRLTIQKGDPCDPSYTKEFKNPFNYSVTWHFQKQFTFKSFANRKTDERQYCDYRQGLVCDYNRKECACPEGSTLLPIEPGSSVNRCQLKPDEFCNLIDLEHGTDSNHLVLAKHIHKMIFNLEKPIGCQSGYQCRFAKGERSHAKCHSNSLGTWNTDTWTLDYGEECTLGLVANPGNCGTDTVIGVMRGYTCYNFGPPGTLGKPGFDAPVDRIGFCAHEYGQYGFTKHVETASDKMEYFAPLFTPFVHPRSVPLRGQELKKFFEDYFANLESCFFIHGPKYGQADNEGDRCSVSKTQALEKAWQYFIDIAKPRYGQDFGTDRDELISHLNSVIDLCKDVSQKFCHVHSDKSASGLVSPSRKCVPAGSSDEGKCRKPGAIDMSSFTKTFREYREAFALATYQQDNEEMHYDNAILAEFPEPPCKPEMGPVAPKARTITDTLEGQLCPETAVCYDDFSDRGDTYDADCNLLESAKQRFVCHDTTQPLGKCELQYLDKKVKDVLPHLDTFAKLEKGDTCDYHIEKSLRENNQEAIESFSKYQLLSMLARGLICDKKGSNVECTPEGTCECTADTCKPRPKTTRKPISSREILKKEGTAANKDDYDAGSGARKLTGWTLTCVLFQVLTIATIIY